MTFLDLLINGLAAFRIALMVSSEDGPAWIFRKLRNAPPKRSSAREGLSCLYCMSVYGSGLVWLARWHGQPWEIALVEILAISAVAICINNQLRRDPS